jgi:UDP-sugar pyrophosphorylase
MAFPKELEGSLSVLTPSQKALMNKLYDLGQEHLFENWKDAPASERQGLASQLESLDQAYGDGGLEGYIKNARKLLENSKQGVNPLADWEPSIPQGETFDFGTNKFEACEAEGMKELGSVGFVLVAGGLGERLGYSSIKVRKIP